MKLDALKEKEEHRKQEEQKREEAQHFKEFLKIQEQADSSSADYQEQLFLLGNAYEERDNMKLAVARWQKAANMGHEKSAEKINMVINTCMHPHQRCRECSRPLRHPYIHPYTNSR